MGKGGGGNQPSFEETMAAQKELMYESHDLQQQAALEAEERAATRRAEEAAAELERRRVAEVEKAQKIAEEEMREGQLMAEASSGIAAEDNEFGNLNLDSPQIESQDYAQEEEVE